MSGKTKATTDIVFAAVTAAAGVVVAIVAVIELLVP